MEKKLGLSFGMIILKESDILPGKGNKDPEKAPNLLYGGGRTMPGRKLEFGGELKQAALREVFEETGIKLKKEKIKVISNENDIVHDALFCNEWG